MAHRSVGQRIPWLPTFDLWWIYAPSFAVSKVDGIQGAQKPLNILSDLQNLRQSNRLKIFITDLLGIRHWKLGIRTYVLVSQLWWWMQSGISERGRWLQKPAGDSYKPGTKTDTTGPHHMILSTGSGLTEFVYFFIVSVNSRRKQTPSSSMCLWASIQDATQSSRVKREETLESKCSVGWRRLKSLSCLKSRNIFSSNFLLKEFPRTGCFEADTSQLT